MTGYLKIGDIRPRGAPRSQWSDAGRSLASVNTYRQSTRNWRHIAELRSAPDFPRFDRAEVR